MLENYQDVLEIKDICAVLRIGRKTAYKLLQSGQIPYCKVGRNYKIRKDALIAYLEGRIEVIRIIRYNKTQLIATRLTKGA